jgi:hypothetical protein
MGCIDWQGRHQLAVKSSSWTCGSATAVPQNRVMLRANRNLIDGFPACEFEPVQKREEQKFRTADLDVFAR